MANVLLTTVGSSGNVNPFVGIGSELRKGGHDVTLFTNCCYEGMARRAGLDFVALDTSEEFERFIEDGPLLNTGPGVPVFLRRHVLPKVIPEYEMIGQRCRPGDTVLVASFTPGIAARVAAENLGLPLVSVLIAPSYITTMPIVEELLTSILNADIDSVRAEVGLPPVRDWRAWWRSPERSIGLWPHWFGAPEPGWPSGVVLTSFLWYDESTTDDVPDEVREFLDSGEPPILITGGTGMFAGPEFYAAGAGACRLLDHRGILVTQHRELIPAGLPENVKWFNYLPLARLIPHMGAVVHHGGMGTLGQALAAGVPQLVLAAGGDRPDNGSRLQRLGVADFLPRPRWQPEVVGEALRRLMNSPVTRKCCQDLARRLRGTDAAAATCEAIETCVPGGRRPAGRGRPAGFDPASQDNHSDGLARTPGRNPRTKELLEQVDTLSPERRAFLAQRLREKRTATRSMHTDEWGPDDSTDRPPAT